MATDAKPAKPYKDFPLFAHANGQWAKKIRGRIYYFGPWIDANAALTLYVNQREDLYAGRTPQTASNTLTVKELCNLFLNAKNNRVERGEMTPRMFTEYKSYCKWLVSKWGNRPVEGLRQTDFQNLKSQIPGKSPNTIATAIRRIRSVFRYAGPDGVALIPMPVQFGSEFCKPSASIMRRHANKRPPIFRPDELRRIIAEADAQLTAMILLGINCGFGNNDCSSLPQSAIDFKTGWINFPRPKTGIDRRCPLWPETIDALRVAIASRPRAVDSADDELVFLTTHGKRWLKLNQTKHSDPISQRFRSLLSRLKLHKAGRGFYTLRAMFETLGGTDQIAIDLIMGHVTPGQGTTYRRLVDDTRLVTAVNVVRTWVIGDGITIAEKPLTVAQAARYLGENVGKVYYWVQNGKLASERVGGRIRVPVSACEALRRVVTGPTLAALPSDAA